MVESHVGSLALRVRAPADRLSAVASASQAFASRVLGRCDEILESRAPGRVVLVSRLDLSLRLLEGALSHGAEIDAFASEIAGAIERQAAAASERPSGVPEIAVFEDEVAWRAAHLEATARRAGAAAWPFDALEAEGEPMPTLLDGDRQPLLLEILTRLYVRGTLIEVLQALPQDVVELLARTLCVRSPALEAEAGTSPLPPPLEASALEASDVPLSVARLAAFIAARAQPSQLADESAAALLVRTAVSSITPPGRKPGERARADGPTPGEEGIETEFGGLFYLLPLALELGLGEILWRACLSEGAVLAAAAALLLGQDRQTELNDCAALVFGGVREVETSPDARPEQQEEIAIELLSSFVEAFPRRGLAAPPEPLLRIYDTPGGRLLVASVRDSAFPFFAFPAGSPEETGRALETFLAHWPTSAPVPRSGFALAGLDCRARVRPLRALPEARPAIPNVGTLSARALLGQIAGSLAHLFAARIGMSPPWQPAGLAVRLAVPSRVIVADGGLEIRIPMERIDLDVRRAGLDADPGYVPWLKRNVRFVFVGASEGA